MRKFKRLTMTLALLIMAVGGAWADETPLVTIESKDYTSFKSGSMTFDDKVTITFSNSVTNDGDAYGWYTASPALLTVAGTNGYTITSCKFYTEYGSTNGYTVVGESPSVYLSSGYVYTDANKSVSIGYPGVKKIEVYGAAAATEWELTSKDGKNWILDKMPASNIELQVEYFAESNLFLSKEALADKGSIAVKAGDLGVQFGDDGKSANTVTEGSAMTVTYNGTKKLLGMKVAKKAVVTYPLLSAATKDDIGKVVCAAGHLHDAKTAVPDGCTAVGILGKVTSTGHGLILALKDAAQQSWNTINGWNSVTTYAGTTLKVLPDDAARGTNLTSYTTLGETTVSNWAVAQKGDYEAIFVNLGSTKSDSYGMTYDGNVNAYFTGAGGTERSNSYWSTTESDAGHAWYFGGGCWAVSNKSDIYSVWPVLGF